jgi:hypothetical protein
MHHTEFMGDTELNTVGLFCDWGRRIKPSFYFPGETLPHQTSTKYVMSSDKLI